MTVAAKVRLTPEITGKVRLLILSLEKKTEIDCTCSTMEHIDVVEDLTEETLYANTTL